MPRRPRNKGGPDHPQRYFVSARCGRHETDAPLRMEAVAARFEHDFWRWAELYFCKSYELTVDHDHVHFYLEFEDERVLSRDELMEKARQCYPNAYKPYLKWTSDDWEHFNSRLFDVSEFMRNLQGGFAQWYNRTFKCRGPFWAERYTSRLLKAEEEAIWTVIYGDLSRLRNHSELAPRFDPRTSASARHSGRDKRFGDLNDLLGLETSADARGFYLDALDFLSAEDPFEGIASAPPDVLEAAARVRLDVCSFLLSRPEITKEPPPSGRWPTGALYYWAG